MRKKDEKKGAIPEKTWAGGSRVGPKGYHFKRFPSEENREESQQKGANKVECKKWSAKGTYRKASADREPTQDLSTLGGQRPRADSWRERAFRRARVFLFVGLWVCGFVCLGCCDEKTLEKHENSQKGSKKKPNGSVVRCQTKLHVVCCGVVGLWGCGVCVCVCVCFIGRVGPKKLQTSA